jgi:hypothetical protein
MLETGKKLRLPSELNPAHELRNTHLKTHCDHFKGADTSLSLAPFQVRQVTPVHAEMHGEIGLRPASFFA